MEDINSFSREFNFTYKFDKENVSFFYLKVISSNEKLMPSLSLHEKNNFRLTKICEKDKKDQAFVTVPMFPFYRNTFFELSFKQKCNKAASFCKCVFLRKYEIFVYDSWM